ncbi:uncharacterized protein LOC120340883 isoform X2 [Styela clava]
MRTLLIAIGLFVFVDASLDPTLTIFQQRYKLSTGVCEPAKGFENKVTPCYDLKSKKLVKPEDCLHKRNSHCCIYNCTCIVKGAGTDQGEILKKYQLPEPKLPAKKKALPKTTLEGCIPIPPPASEQPKNTPKPMKPTPKKPAGPTPKKPVRPTPKKPMRPTPKKPVRPTPKKPMKPTPKKPMKPTPKKPMKPTPKKPTKPKPKKPMKPTPKKPVKPTPKKPAKPIGKKPAKPTPKKPAPKKPMKPTPKKPISKKPGNKKPKRPTPKPRKPTPKPKKPTRPTKTPARTTKKMCTTTKGSRSAFQASFFERLLMLTRGFGFEGEVVKEC